MARICLITTGQPSSNPRVVKEADALTEAGHRVKVVCAFWAAWADAADSEWLRSRAWTCQFVGGHPERRRVAYLKTRLRHGLAKRALRWSRRAQLVDALMHRALNRTTPELITAANADRADLYIAHNLGALPAAVIAAKRHGALAGFDAEDFHTGESMPATIGDNRRLFAIRVEERFIRQCDYVSASSPDISNLYASRYGIQPPLTLLNVFPLQQQPAHREERSSRSLRLYWFSQTIGANRGLDDVVRAMGRISDQEVELHLQGTWQPGYREFLYKLASRNGVRESVIIAHEPGLPDEMPRIAAQFDIGLSPEQPLSINKNYCLGNKIFTYLLAGNAIVATETKAQSRLLESIGSAATGYAPGDIDALSNILRELHEDRGLLEQARKSSWRAGREKYNWDSEKIKFLDRIDNLLRH